MKLIMDSDVQAVAEFMQSNIPASKLMGVAESLPQIARLLWSQYQQEPYVGMQLKAEPITNGLQLNATEFVPAVPCVDGCSAEEACIGLPQ